MLLLDEPSMGLSPILVQEIFDCITEVNRDGTTVLLVEQNAKMALSISRRAYVLETGTLFMEGDAADLLNNEEIRRAYLGSCPYRAAGTNCRLRFHVMPASAGFFKTKGD
jgi:branched-chain amino acid ABC transporter, ATP-binding protein